MPHREDRRRRRPAPRVPVGTRSQAAAPGVLRGVFREDSPRIEELLAGVGVSLQARVAEERHQVFDTDIRLNRGPVSSPGIDAGAFDPPESSFRAAGGGLSGRGVNRLRERTSTERSAPSGSFLATGITRTTKEGKQEGLAIPRQKLSPGGTVVTGPSGLVAQRRKRRR